MRGKGKPKLFQRPEEGSNLEEKTETVKGACGCEDAEEGRKVVFRIAREDFENFWAFCTIAGESPGFLISEEIKGSNDERREATTSWRKLYATTRGSDMGEKVKHFLPSRGIARNRG